MRLLHCCAGRIIGVVWGRRHDLIARRERKESERVREEREREKREREREILLNKRLIF